MARQLAFPVPRSLALLVPAMALALLLHEDGAFAAACDPTGADAAAVTTARSAVESSCDCATAATHKEHVACSRAVLKNRIQDGHLPRSCFGTLQRRAARSTCGRPGAVTCCETRANGVTHGRIRAAADACRAPRGGSACVGSYPSAHDACDADGCAPLCGNGIVERSEACDGQVFCDPSCEFELTVCCGSVPAGQAGLCADATIETYQQLCLQNGLGGTRYGGTPGATCDPETAESCPTGEICEGTCRPSATFPATTLCCQANGACADTQVTDTMALFQFGELCLGEGIGIDVGLGTCDSAAGLCQPGG